MERELAAIYLETLRRCAPEILIAKVWRNDFPRSVVAIGKCAGALRDGIDCDDAFVALPRGYRQPKKPAQIATGSHPGYSDASFDAGEALLRFVDAHDDITFLISGGGSACVEVPAEGFTRAQLVEENERLLAAGLPIGAINARRKEMSAIKGGKLASRVRGRCVTLVYSDVSRGALADVASGPTLSSFRGGQAPRLSRSGAQAGQARAPVLHGEDVHLIADNDTLTSTAAAIANERGFNPVRWPEQIEGDVGEAARFFAGAKFDDIFIAGGEPTVVKRGDGQGGRCSELALRYLLAGGTAAALFGSSDGADGNSGVAGIEIDGMPTALNRHEIETALERSDSFPVASQIGRATMIPAAGNNLRDLYLLARG